MADMGSIPPGFQVMVQRMNQRLENLQNKVDKLERRVVDTERELQRRKGGRPKRQEAA